MKSEIINNFIEICGKKHVLTENWNKETYCKGWRYGSGEAIAVVKPGTLLEIWKVLNICNESNLIIIMQAANTGLTGGSTPYGEDYDRDIVIINTMRINDIHLLNNAKQIIGLTGSTLYDLERKLDPYDREPHSVIGSTSIGASIIGGVCNNSGGSLVQRGPSYTELALYARINEKGKLELINELDIYLGNEPEEILKNLEDKKYKKKDIIHSKKIASDNMYSKIVRDINSKIPARFNSDDRLLYLSLIHI